MTFRVLTGLIDKQPRLVFLLISASCVALLAFGIYLQQVVGLVPCPMCIVQRYALVLVALIAGLTGAGSRKGLHLGGSVLLLITAGFGGFVAARQSWLQWYPPEVASCGRDFYGMIETFPLQRALPMIFKGGGDCIKVDWTFLGGSIANWSFVCFSGITILACLLIWRISQARS
ncbi:MAG: disulfide bond formation protein B [Rhodoferax sp.]|uniref:disulfide bond formation protein B n=1 Tax=Rhodoferax sp. TaxID=50421 RepID=UPI0030181721